jgi:hypothetical protein
MTCLRGKKTANEATSALQASPAAEPSYGSNHQRHQRNDFIFSVFGDKLLKAFPGDLQ